MSATPDEFLHFLGLIQNEKAQALAWLAEHPELSDTSTPGGVQCAKMAIQENDTALVKAMLDQRMNPADLLTEPGYPPGLSLFGFAAFLGRPDVLEVLLTHPRGKALINHPIHMGSPLSMTYDRLRKAQAPAMFGDPTPNVPQYVACMQKLLAHGADTQAKFPDGKPEGILLKLTASLEHEIPPNELLRAFARYAPQSLEQHDPVTGHTPLMNAAWHLGLEHIRALMEGGADLLARNAGEKTVLELPVDPNSQLLDPQSHLKKSKAEIKRYLQELNVLARKLTQEDLTPAQLVGHLTAQDNGASLLVRILAADLFGTVVSSTYWDKHGGFKHGLDYVRQLQESLGPHFAHFASRIDLSPFQREAETPHEGSVLVQHVRGEDRKKDR